jgi:hypothetical protein
MLAAGERQTGAVARSTAWLTLDLKGTDPMADVLSITPTVRNANAERQARWRAKRNAIAKSAEKRLAFSPQLCVAVASLTVTTVLLALSLVHLSTGIEMITHCHRWEAIALALGVDAAMVCCEAALLVSGATALKLIKAWASWTILITVVASAGLNSLAFASQAGEGAMFYAAIAAGCAVPALIFSLTKIAAGLVSTR